MASAIVDGVVTDLQIMKMSQVRRGLEGQQERRRHRGGVNDKLPDVS